ncbi:MULTISPECIES: hypothetical protein [unclassified Rickettsia]|uniref:hypothetical protein n=1 Tax=unclassified Rickettsia TaxID=114295 RepID=UPI003133442F
MSKKKEIDNDNLETQTNETAEAANVGSNESESSRASTPISPETMAIISKELESLTNVEKGDGEPEAEESSDLPKDASMVISSETGEAVSNLQDSDEVDALGDVVRSTEIAE